MMCAVFIPNTDILLVFNRLFKYMVLVDTSDMCIILQGSIQCFHYCVDNSSTLSFRGEFGQQDMQLPRDMDLLRNIIQPPTADEQLKLVRGTVI